ncbi:MAG: hypothetical protein HOJ15_02945 [Candidatus Jacksonbacteria bacterium]|mgnify:CR=1 FL=1|jgi:hypothetical protein|nr:hypothetical protein [Candidatus Jacksonbacteria bacterium]MBT6034248.1 hypothetical protein [Candidatus Jacksonbacteria bacterium]MBT6301354.1 hypothetical protein [Candidatus Jacksonbacteria bacterium]MBT6756728.1 hypothetical protein [Candidatus Jacksonbacteria bacterium]MBT6954992.1 hypothetical protein [Candidatus Jacksonbacteria bacterium]
MAQKDVNIKDTEKKKITGVVTNKKAVHSFVYTLLFFPAIALFAFMGMGQYLAFLFPLAGMVLGYRSLSELAEERRGFQQKGKKLARSSLIISISLITIGVISFLLFQNPFYFFYYLLWIPVAIFL